MAETALQDALTAAGARMGEFAGATTALSFGDTAREFAALRQGCGVSDLGWRAKLLITGGDRSKWLNGIVTNNIRDLAQDRGCYNFLLNAQGHILADMYLYNRGEYVLLDTDHWQAAKVRETFDRFIIMDDVEVADASEKLTAIGLIGPRASDVLKATGVDAAGLEPQQVRDTLMGGAGVSLVAKEHGYEVWAGAGFAASVWDALVAAGATPAGAEARELWRVAQGVPRYGQDIRERELPQETQQERALNFSKGCYIGQEIVERVRSRGAVHRHFTGFLLEGPASPGAKVQKDGKDVGEITSVATLPSANGGRTVALGYIRREAGAPGALVQVEGAAARIAELPFLLVET